MLNKLMGMILLAALVLSMAACTTKDADATTLPVQESTQLQTTGASSDETTEPTEEVAHVTVPSVSTPTKVTQPVETQPSESQPSTEPTTGTQDEVQNPTSYEAYNAMSAEEQAAFYNSFANPNDFFAWMTAAKKEYEENKDQTILDGNTNIDMGGN